MQNGKAHNQTRRLPKHTKHLIHVAARTLHDAVWEGRKETAELLIANGADVNAKADGGNTPLDWAKPYPEIADLLRKHGGKTAEELKAEGKMKHLLLTTLLTTLWQYQGFFFQEGKLNRR